jgi:hypothetical protein
VIDGKAMKKNNDINEMISKKVAKEKKRSEIDNLKEQLIAKNLKTELDEKYVEDPLNIEVVFEKSRERLK